MELEWALLAAAGVRGCGYWQGRLLAGAGVGDGKSWGQNEKNDLVVLIIGQQLCRNFKSDISLLAAAIASPPRLPPGVWPGLQLLKWALAS
jgi:hypothetical protein